MVRIFASPTTRVSLDVTGTSVSFTESDPNRRSPDARAKQLLKALEVR